jgi:hypothetical protein
MLIAVAALSQDVNKMGSHEELCLPQLCCMQDSASSVHYASGLQKSYLYNVLFKYRLWT